jgi:cell division protein FtsI/penicillin-binding protein 2
MANKWRLQLLFGTLSLLFLPLVARLFVLQVAEHGRLAALAYEEHWRSETINPRRGEIYDRNGILMAGNVQTYRLYAVPRSLPDAGQVADILGSLLRRSRSEIYSRLSSQGNEYVMVARELSKDDADRVVQLAIPGLFLEAEPRRYYPNGVLASHVLGFSNVDNKGAYGVEGYYDQQLAGTAGTLTAERDIAGKPLAIGPRTFSPPVDGKSIVLSLDATVQIRIEAALDRSVAETGAEGGQAIVMDPYTGEIVALAVRPAFDPNRYQETDMRIFLNPAVSQVYEPGSTFKLITMAAGLDAGVITPSSSFQCKGYMEVPGGMIRSSTGAHGRETMTEVLQHSCNVGSSWVAERLGTQLFYRYVRALGFGRVTGIDLQGEVAGIVKQPEAPSTGWYPIDLYTNSFGQGISVTPVQLLRAVAAIANGGELVRPRVVLQPGEPPDAEASGRQQAIRVLTMRSTKLLLGMMEEATSNSIGPRLGLPGYRIAAKTGTAQIPKNGKLDEDATITSVVAVLPVSRPEFVFLVRLDRPKSSIWAGDVAAPLAGAVAKILVDRYGIPPDAPR